MATNALTAMKITTILIAFIAFVIAKALFGKDNFDFLDVNNFKIDDFTPKNKDSSL